MLLKRFFIFSFLTIFITLQSLAQDIQETKPNAIGKSKPENPVSILRLNVDSAVTTKHTVNIKGVSVAYTATTGAMPVWDADGKPVAGVFYTYYERDNVPNRDSRPIVISFNGGPGTPSLWMEIGYTGPRMLKIDDEGYPVQPYGMQDNPNSILDIADIVYLDPVNTGYSRKTDKETSDTKFYGVNEDIAYLADWISTFITRKNRWASPKFLIGESYGTTRASGLALALQQREWMFLNGVVLVSPTTLGIERSGPLAAALRLPYFSATAWYHKKLPADLQSQDLTAFLPAVEKYAIDELLPAIAKGSSIAPEERARVVAQFARYSGLDTSVISGNNLDVSPDVYWKELLKKEGYTIGRLDSRYKGIDKQSYGTSPDYNAELESWANSFTPAMNIYLRNELNYKTDIRYNIFGSVWPWNNRNNNVAENLRLAMAANPNLHLLVQSGYFDGACDYFNAKYSMWQMDPAGILKPRMKWEGYRSGHMLYLRKEDHETASENLRKFIESSLNLGKAIKY
ncbi:MAG: carboxypeptidase [Chitinophagaceae bacterium]|jgi:carboxypeptidase C (cathepsin A)|nr:carboxypeptidase [Chitinophagaceae bacterium]